MVRVPPVNESGPEKLVACAVPLAAVFTRTLERFEITRSEVDAMPVESEVVVAPVAVMFANTFVPVKVLFTFVFAMVVDAVMTLPTRSGV